MWQFNQNSLQYIRYKQGATQGQQVLVGNAKPMSVVVSEIGTDLLGLPKRGTRMLCTLCTLCMLQA